MTTSVERLQFAVLRTARQVRTKTETTLTHSQQGILDLLAQHPDGLTVGQIAKIEDIKPPSASRLVTALDKAGLVKRVGTDDARSQIVQLNAAGRKLAAKSVDVTWLSGRIGTLPKNEQARLLAVAPLLEKVVGAS